MTAAAAVRVRVWVMEVWDIVELSLSADTTMAELKQQALVAATGRTPDPAAYAVKFRGAVVDPLQTLGDLGAADGAPFIVLAARRHPVR